MQKHLYRFLVVTVIFLLSLFFFIASMKETSYTHEAETTDMSDASFPVMAMLRGGNEINTVYGYNRELTGFGVREELTPLEKNNKIDFIIHKHENEIMRLEYEVRERASGIAVETGELSEFEEIDGEDECTGELSLKTALNSDTEYVLKSTLVSASGRKTYFFTTVKYTDGDHFKENYNFVKEFESAAFSKKSEKSVKPYLESNRSMENTSFGYANIHSSYEIVSWGKLKPEKITDISVRVTENGENITAFIYEYIMSIGSETKSYYNVKEYYRVNYTERAMYLLAFERKTEEFYSPENTSMTRSQLKFGISEGEPKEFLTSENDKYISFVRERELWLYDVDKNKLKRIFSFRKEGFDDERLLNGNHKVKPLRLDISGDLYFTVYGYMNRGVYEGRTAILLYKYYNEENRIEELAHIPVETTFQMLNEDLDKFSYVSGDSFFYFIIYDKIYAYSLVKKKTEIIADNVYGSSYTCIADEKVIAWQAEPDVRKSGFITLMNLNTREKKLIKPENGSVTALIGRIYGNIIYATAKPSDISENNDGSLFVPYKKVIITDTAGNVLKEYDRKNIYVTEAEVTNNVIYLTRVKKKGKSFKKISGDQILNNLEENEAVVSIVERRTEKFFKEYYLRLPKGVEIKEIPAAEYDVKNTVITTDTTVKLPLEENRRNRYYANTYGSLSGSSVKASDMIISADGNMGYVVDRYNQTVWERGNRKIFAKADEVDADYIYETDTSMQSAVRLFLTAKGIYIPDSELHIKNAGIMDILNNQTDIKPINLTGVTLDEALYYVSERNPVIAVKDKKTAVIITEYTPNTVTLMDVKTGETEAVSKEEAAAFFEKAGNVFVSVIG